MSDQGESDYEALSGELARELEWCRDRFDAILARLVVRDVAEMRHAVDCTLARYYAARRYDCDACDGTGYSSWRGSQGEGVVRPCLECA